MMNIFIDDVPSTKLVKDVVSMADKGIKKMKGMNLQLYTSATHDD